MVNIDALLLEWAYRCKKGYPDLDSPSDLRILKSILKEQGISLPLSEDLSGAEQAPNTKEIDSKQEFLNLLDKEDIKPENIRKLSAMVIQFDPDFQLDEEEDLTNKIVDNKDDLFDQINQAENLTPEQFRRLSSTYLSFEYEEEIKALPPFFKKYSFISSSYSNDK